MVPFIVVWSRNTIHVYPDTSGKKERWRYFIKNRQFLMGNWVRKFGDNFAKTLRKKHGYRQFLMGKWVRKIGNNLAKNLRTFCEKFTEIGRFSWGNGAGNVAIIFCECDVILLIAALRCTRNLFVAHLASWSSPFMHQDQLVVFRQLLGVFDVTRFICRLRPRRWPFVSIFIAISGVSLFIRIFCGYIDVGPD